MANYKYYPDADPEVSSVDGFAQRSAAGTWSQVRTGVGTQGYDDISQLYVHIIGTSTPLQWENIGRVALLFDTSGIPSGFDIIYAEIRLYCFEKYISNLDPLLFSYGVYSSNPASDTAIVASDYSNFGTTLLSTLAHFYYLIPENGYITFPLTSSGIALINKSGISKFAVREVYHDAAGNEPSVLIPGIAPIVRVGFLSIDAGGDTTPRLLVVAGHDGFGWIEGTYWHYTDEYGAERRIQGGLTGLTGKTPGQISINIAARSGYGKNFCYIDSTGAERAFWMPP